MRTRAFLVVVIAGALLAAGSSLRRGAAATTRPPAVFVSDLPAIGTVYARYYCTRSRSLRFALGIHILETGQSTLARFRAGRFSRDRELQPGDPTAWFPYRPSRVEWLAAAAGGENGTVVGWVRVVGYSAHVGKSCSGYAPPRVTVQIYPRRYYSGGESFGRILRRFIG